MILHGFYISVLTTGLLLSYPAFVRKATSGPLLERRNAMNKGSILYSVIGHPFEVLIPGPFRVFVQALTPRHDGQLVPIGAPCWASMSDFKAVR